MKSLRYRQHLLFIALFCSAALAAVPRQIAYQGVLTDASGNPRPDGKYYFQFALFAAETGGSAIPGFSQAESLIVKNGIFSTILGKSGGINLPFNDPYWLGVTVNGTAMGQRLALGAAAYAIRSAVADSAGKASNAGTAARADSSSRAGMSDSAKAVRGGGARVSQLHDAGLQNASVTVDGQGRVGIGTASPTMRLDLRNGALGVSDVNYPNINARLECQTTGMGKLRFTRWDGTTVLNNCWIGHFLNSSNSQYQLGFAVGGAAGTQNTGNADTAEVRMTIQPGGNVGIGTITPGARLHLLSSTELLRLDRPANTTTQYISFNTGNIPHAFIGLENSSGTGLFGSGQGNGLSIGTVENTGISLHTGNVTTPRLLISRDGNVGIGESNPTKAKLVVAGNVLAAGPEFISDGLRASLFLGDEHHKVESQAAKGLFLSTYGARDALFIAQDMPGIQMPGYVGIGTLSPSERLTVAGSIKACGALITDATLCSSDRRYKANISPIDSALSKISSLRGVTYDWDSASFPERNFPNRKQVGLIAQEVEEIIPELVATDNQGYKSLSYDKLTAVLIEAIKEQQAVIELQKQHIADLQQSHTLQIQKMSEQERLIEHLLSRVTALEEVR